MEYPLPVRLDFSALKRIRDGAGVDLLRIGGNGELATLITRLGDDPLTLIEVLFSALKPALQEAGKTQESFAQDMLDGPTYALQAGAFWEAFSDFFRARHGREAGEKMSAGVEDLKRALFTIYGSKPTA